MKYLKWIFNRDVGEDKKFQVGKVTCCDTWDPTNTDWDKRGGFNFTNEESAFRWMSRGDTLYEVTLPDDAEMIEVKNDKTPGGIMVTNKIIINNPVPISEELLLDLYNKSKLPLTTYFETIGFLAARSYYDLALKVIKDKINMDNIDIAIEEFNDSIKSWHSVDNDTYNSVKEVLDEIKSDILINLYVDKEPYIKELSSDKIINLTGQTGSGKSTYANEHFNSDDYVIIDTDEIVYDNRYPNAKGINKELGTDVRNKYEVLPNCGDDFDLIYKEILDYCKNIDKTIVIDCAQFHCIKDISLLKGKLIILRTAIDTCYHRTIERYKKNNPNYTEEELDNYIERKKAIFKWYKFSNSFIEKIDSIRR